MKKPAVFLDRDNTLIEDPGYLSDPGRVKLLPGAAEAVRRFSDSGFRVVVATNQSGVARGLITVKQIEDIHARLKQLLEEQNAKLDGVYYCPYLDSSEAIVPEYRADSDLRKPQPGMLLKAASDLELDLDHSWMVGDSTSDIQAGLSAGCKTILLGRAESSGVQADFTAESLSEAADVVLNNRAQGDSQPNERSESPKDDEAITGLLTDIRSILQQQRREASQQDFSLARLGAALCQMVAVAVMLWGLAAMLGGEVQPSLARFALAGVVQLLALTLFVVDRSR